MASISPPKPLDPARSYKGHPQPPIDERLAQAKNFLADEDVNRCLGFMDKLAQVEDYLKYIEKEQLACDPELLQDVKTMAAVTRDWHNRMDAPLGGTSCNDLLGVPKFSSRLIDSDNAKKLEDERERRGRITKMRDDHAPFTIDRSADQVEFLKRLKKDAETRPEDVMESENLLHIEDEAYSWALDQPWMIPYWMHWDKGLPNKGINAADRPRVNRPREGPSDPTPLVSARPSRDKLPKFLEEMEKDINSILDVKNLRTDHYVRLYELLHLFEPKDLRDQYTALKSLEGRCEILENLNLDTEGERDKLEQEKKKFHENFEAWLDKWKENRAQINLLKDGVEAVDDIGVLYAPTHKPPIHTKRIVKLAENRINALLLKGQLSEKEKKELHDLLLPYLPTRIRHLDQLIQEESISVIRWDTRLQSLQTHRLDQFDRWIGMLRTVPNIILALDYLGADISASQGVLSSPWPSQYFPENPGDPGQIPPEIKKLESDINDYLYALGSEDSSDGGLPKLEALLPDVMYPGLRKLSVEIDVWNRRGDRMTYRQQQDQLRREQQYEEAFLNWVELLKLRTIQVRLPTTQYISTQTVEESPNTLYFRGHDDRFQVEDTYLLLDTGARPPPTRMEEFDAMSFAQWGAKIQSFRRNQPLDDSWIDLDLQHDDRGGIYKLLANLQYPRLRQLDLEWRKSYSKPEPTEAEMELRPVIRRQWQSEFFRWQQCFGDKEITILRPDQLEDLRYPEGDPGILYYRGPIRRDLGGAFHPDSIETVEPLPADVKRDQDRAQAILTRMLNNVDARLSEEDNSAFDKLLDKYWGPAEYYRTLQQADDENARLQAQKEFQNRRRCFIDQCVSFGMFEILRLPMGKVVKYIARDTTPNYSERWKVGSAGQSLFVEDPSIEFTPLLNRLWVDDPSQYKLTSMSMEYKINRLLREYNQLGTQFSKEKYEEVFRLLRPFLPPRLDLATFDQEARYIDWFHFFRELADIARTHWIRTRSLDPDNKFTKRRKNSGDIFFCVPPKPADHTEPMDVVIDPLPIGFQRIQSELNELLRLCAVRGLKFAEYDRLRILMRTIMSPDDAREDDELRVLDQQWREGLLDQTAFADYLARQANFAMFLGRLIESFDGNDIKLVQAEQEVTSPGTQVIQIKSPLDLPPDFLSNDLPTSLLSIQNGINEYLKSTRDDGDPYYQEVVRILWSKHGVKWAQQSIQDLQGANLLRPNEEIGPEYASLIRSIINHKIYHAVARLSDKVKANKVHVKLYERRRGDLAWKMVRGAEKDDLLAPQIARSSKTDKADLLAEVGKISSAAVGLNAARDEYLELVKKATAKTLTNSEREKIAQSLISTEEQRQEARQHLLVSVIKLSKGTALTQEDEQRCKEVFSLLLWYTFGTQNPALREEILQAPVPTEILVEGDLRRSPNLPVIMDDPPKDDERDEIALHLNNQLTSYKEGKLTKEEISVLDYLMRPLARGRLAELFDQITSLEEERRQVGTEVHVEEFAIGEGMALAEYKRQYNAEFHQWKNDLPVILLDDMYFRSEDVNRVIQRYRLWRKSEERGSPTRSLAPSEGFDKDNEQLLEKYDLLKLYVSKAISSSQLQKLNLEQLPPSLQGVRRELNNLLVKESDNTQSGFGERFLLLEMKRRFIKDYLEWFKAGLVVAGQQQQGLSVASSAAVDFTGKAERRGVQRAAVELGLNLLATNQEQHRPHDKFRMVRLPPKYQPPQKEVPLWVPLEPWHWPVELEPYKYTKVMRKHREWKDEDYHTARHRGISDQPGHLPAPENFGGPHTATSDEDLAEIYKNRLNELLSVQSELLAATDAAPRLLIQRLNILIDESCRNIRDIILHPRLVKSDGELDWTPLTTKETEILRQIAQPSWREDALNYPDQIPGIDPTDPRERAKFMEFVHDVEEVMHEIPFWHGGFVEGDNLEQQAYNPNLLSQRMDGGPGGQGWKLVESAQPQHDSGLLKYINDRRLKEARDYNDNDPHLWTKEEAQTYLKAMHAAKQIFFTKSQGNLVARIPPDGHPENKWVTSRDTAGQSPGVKRNPTTNLFEVQYDVTGFKGPPIIQPNKYEFLQKIALKLGRDIGDMTLRLSNPQYFSYEMKSGMRRQSEQLTRKHMNDLAAGRGLKVDDSGFEPGCDDLPDPPGAKDVSVKKMARDLHKIAPDLAQTAGIALADPIVISDKDAGQIVQMQLLEEINNCWESRFPENEHVWEFAEPRVNAEIKLPSGRKMKGVPTQYFNMRRYPLPCQCLETQTRIKKNALALQEKPVPPKPAPVLTWQEMAAKQKRELKEKGRHTGKGQLPAFLFGETPFQQSYLSLEIENHLADVEEFYPKPDPPNWIQRNLPTLQDLKGLPGKLWPFGRADDDSSDSSDDDHDDPYALPKIPKSWKPDSVSRYEKRHDIAERLLKERGNRETEPLYFSPLEIELKKAHGERERIAKAKKAATIKMEEKAKKPWRYIKNAERRRLMDECDIDPVTEMERPKPSAKQTARSLAQLGGGSQIEQIAPAGPTSGAVPPFAQPSASTATTAAPSLMTGALGPRSVPPIDNPDFVIPASGLVNYTVLHPDLSPTTKEQEEIMENAAIDASLRTAQQTGDVAYPELFLEDTDTESQDTTDSAEDSRRAREETTRVAQEASSRSPNKRTRRATPGRGNMSPTKRTRSGSTAGPSSMKRPASAERLSSPRKKTKMVTTQQDLEDMVLIEEDSDGNLHGEI